uniref:Radial spoke head 1 homolog n=1 Tax=Clastoptera arizonana TaxID=38151 RepID=A0A1B6DY95_9HEMI
MSDENINKEDEGEGENTIGEYLGQRNELKQRHGRGRAFLPNGDYYMGTYSKGLRNGWGWYIFKGGAQYKGDYKEGMKHGIGIFYYPDGSIYEGQWKKDYRHGEGIYKYPNGDTYDGSWKVDKRNGLGNYHYKEFNVKFLGVWVDGKMNGLGKITYPKYIYYGMFEDNMPKGKGCFVFPDYCIQYGHYVILKNPEYEEEIKEDLPLDEQEEKFSLREGFPKGIVPVWRPSKIGKFSLDLVPPDPKLEPTPSSIGSTEDEIKIDTSITSENSQQNKSLTDAESEHGIVSPRSDPVGEITDEEAAAAGI